MAPVFKVIYFVFVLELQSMQLLEETKLINENRRKSVVTAFKNYDFCLWLITLHWLKKQWKNPIYRMLWLFDNLEAIKVIGIGIAEQGIIWIEATFGVNIFELEIQEIG